MIRRLHRFFRSARHAATRRRRGKPTADIGRPWLPPGIIVAALVISTAHGRENDSITLSPDRLTARVDELIADHLQQIGWAPAGPCSDAEFMRRACLDLTGRPPSASEVADFLADQHPAKRERLVDRLVDSPEHAEHLAAVWTDYLIPEADTPLRVTGRAGLQRWLHERFAGNLRYDRLVADLLTASGPIETGPTAFFLALETQPEKIAARTSRVFLGVQLDCAECHDHPFSHWTQRDFWGLAAYFAQIANGQPGMGMGGGELIELSQGEVRLQGTDEVVFPKPLLDVGTSGLPTGTRRQQLTLWLCAPENPLLARTAVNRVWALLFGRGLVEPLDDIRSYEQASHPQLLQELTDYFVASEYDLRNLLRALAKTELYRRSHRHPSGSAPVESYAVMPIKPLSRRQMAASLLQVGRQIPAADSEQIALWADRLGVLRGDASEAKLGIVTALVTLHGPDVDLLSREHRSPLLIALTAPHMDLPQQLRWLFLATLNRPPSVEEMQLLVSEAMQQAEHGEEAADQWLSDLLWALLNSTEFAMIP
ncbi:MAG: hypothetical protein KatS3mg111_3026 [Pirellulaceae bacterium]|nr:MAG: hypothetical protein KatS3mg111_3026 [Pirellulaceae bacterium]